MIKLVGLLGNPGGQYERTRHNAAWLLAAHCGWDDGPWKAKWNAWFTEVELGGSRVLLVKPQKFMNRSGESLSHFARFHRFDLSEIAVVHDDVELSFGDISWKDAGGLAGHNGLRSLASSLGGQDFGRLRIGIGRPSRGTVSSHVLGAFSRAEVAELPRIFDEAHALLEQEVRDSAARH